MAEFRNQGITLKTTVGKLIDFVGKKAVKKTLQESLPPGAIIRIMSTQNRIL
jgi:hypothetical protein